MDRQDSIRCKFLIKHSLRPKYLLCIFRTQIAAQYPSSGATVKTFTHSWVQGSIIARIPGTTTGPVTILGAHMDSINLSNPTSGRAPGADDDGTGSVNLLEAFRTLLAAGFKPKTPVEFHW
jgi:bacterial leucyl aminopeptidase